MSEGHAPQLTWKPASRQRFRLGSAIALGLVVVLLVAFWANDGGGSSSTTTTTSGQASVTAASVAQLRQAATAVGHPIYWVGIRNGERYELTEQPDGTTLVRYLPSGVPVGASGHYLTVATYPFANAIDALRALTAEQQIPLPGGGLAVVEKSDPSSIHVAYPGEDVQIEVFEPTPGAAQKLVLSGRLAALRPS
jgi:hypothetical protein